MRPITHIFIHCTASSQHTTIPELLAHFRARGWHNPGYHYTITPDGTVHQLLDLDKIANGVRGYNQQSIHISYIGGITATGAPIDNRTPQQKAALRALLRRLRPQFPKAQILGHRDISPDRNHDGRISPSERIKECPCFDAIPEYKDI